MPSKTGYTSVREGAAVKKWAWHVVRLFVCAGGLAFVLSGLEWDQFRSAWQGSDKLLLIVAFTLFMPVLFLQSLRFAWMLKAQSISVSYWESLKLSCMGNFFNNFVPAGLVGGDLVKAYYVAQRTVQKTEAVTAVVLDRALGLVVLVFFALAGLTIKLDWPIADIGWLAGGLGLGLILILVVVVSRRRPMAYGLARLVERLPAADHLRRIGRATLRLHEHSSLTIAAVLATLVSHAIILTSFTVAAVAVGMQADLVAHFAYLAISLLIAAIPISPAGLGTMEAAMTFLFVGAELGHKEQVLLLAITMRAIQLFWALPGGAMFATGACRPHPIGTAEPKADAVVET